MSYPIHMPTKMPSQNMPSSKTYNLNSTFGMLSACFTHDKLTENTIMHHIMKFQSLTNHISYGGS